MKNLQEALMLLALALLFAGSVRAQEVEETEEETTAEYSVDLGYGLPYYTYVCSYPVSLENVGLFYVEAFNPAENIMYTIFYKDEKKAIEFTLGYTSICQLLVEKNQPVSLLNTTTEYLGKWINTYFACHEYEEIDFILTKGAGIYTYMKLLQVK